MEWLTILHFRAPRASVMLVANKCDKGIEEYSQLRDRVENRVRTVLEEWQSKRALGDQHGKNLASVSLLRGTSLVSCQTYTGISELVQRISEFGSTSIEVPPSWNLALAVLNALRTNKSPLAVASEHLGLSSAPMDIGREGKWTQTSVTRDEISSKWQDIVRSVKLKATSERARTLSDLGLELAMPSSTESALEGALWIR